MLILTVYALLILHLILQALWYIIPTDYKTIIINVDILHRLYIEHRQILLIFRLWIIVCYLIQIVFDLLILQLRLMVDVQCHCVLADVVRESFVCWVELSLGSWIVAQGCVVELSLIYFLELGLAARVVSVSVLGGALDDSLGLNELCVLVDTRFLRDLDHFLVFAKLCRSVSAIWAR